MTARLPIVMMLAGMLLGAAATAPEESEVDVTVLGVTAPFATFGLLKHLLGIPGVREAHFNLLRGVASLRMARGASVTDDDLRAAIRSASYTPGDIRRIAAPGTGN